MDDDPRSAIAGFVTADIVSPSPTSWAVLDVGDNEDGEFAFPGAIRSEDQYLTRCKELSKLLKEDRQYGGKNEQVNTYLM